METLNVYGFKNNYVVHLSVNAEEDLDFIELEQIKNDLISVKEKFEKISQRHRF